MPIIIDANCAGDFTKPACAHAPEILRRISQRKMRVVIGGKLLSELAQTKLRTLLLEWERGGRTHRLKDDEVERITQEFQSQTIESDDPHVLAVALLSGCRLIYTFDANLIKDFKNIRLLSPKGKVVTPTTSKRVADALFNEKGG